MMFLTQSNLNNGLVELLRCQSWIFLNLLTKRISTLARDYLKNVS